MPNSNSKKHNSDQLEPKEYNPITQEMIDALYDIFEKNKREEEKKYYRQLNLKGKRGLTIGFKLILFVSIVILVSLTSMTFMSSQQFMKDVKSRIEEENLGTSNSIAEQTQQNLWSVFNRAQLLLLSLSGSNKNQEIQDFFFNKNPEFLYLGLADHSFDYYNKTFLLNNNMKERDINEIVIPELQQYYAPFLSNRNYNDIKVVNFSAYFEKPVTAILFPYRQQLDAGILIALVDTDLLFNNLLRSGNNQKVRFIMDDQGQIIAHSDPLKLLESSANSEHPVLQQIQSNSGNSKQIRYSQTFTDPLSKFVKEETFLAAYKSIDFGNLIFVTEVEEFQVFESVYDIQKKNFYIMMIVVSLSILIVYFFSKTITTPVGKLVIATQYIDRGDYTPPLQVQTRDEIGLLTQSFLDMTKGLMERERLKDSFGKFVNQEIAELASKGELPLGGETKEATIFFSDIRKFTSISEKLAPEEIVHFLNEYMTLMVNCINDFGGFVDKFIGDAIMAVWGAPVSRGNDEERTINAALGMRTLLQEFNKGRGSEKQPIIVIGCGINSGPVLAGQIGSQRRMEYTVIGDTVNLASRLEALNKPMGTDILISQETKERVEGIFHLFPMNTIKVKGKAQAQNIFAVLGRVDDPDCPASLKELRERIGIEGDFSNIADLNDEEVKYEIID